VSRLLKPQNLNGGGGSDGTLAAVTLLPDPNSETERVLTAGAGLTLTDNGADSTVVLAMATVATVNPGTYDLANVTVDAYGRVVAITAAPTPIAGWPIYEAIVLETEASQVALSQAISTNSRRHQVIVNGRIMAQGGEADYTLTSTTITFTSTLEAGSRVLVYAYPSNYA
jgi:hypothetical protein